MWIPTERTELIHSAKGTRWANHKYTDIVNGRYIYPKSGNIFSTGLRLYNTVNGNPPGKDTILSIKSHAQTPKSTKSNHPSYNQGVNSRKSKAANQPKKKKQEKLSRSQYHQHGGTSGNTRFHGGSSGDVNLKSSARNKGHKQYETDKKKLAADAVARAEKNKRQYENAKINAARAAGEKQRREANELARKKKHNKQMQIKFARDKGRKQVAALHKPTLMDHARNFLHEGSIKYNRFVRGLSEAFNGGSKKKSKKRKK